MLGTLLFGSDSQRHISSNLFFFVLIFMPSEFLMFIMLGGIHKLKTVA